MVHGAPITRLETGRQREGRGKWLGRKSQGTSTHTQSNDGATRQLTQIKRSKRPPPFVELEKEKVVLATAIGYISDEDTTINLDGAAETR